jgi:AraC-like DNA-binding protein
LRVTTRSVDVTEDETSQGLPTTMGFAAKQAIDALRRRNVAIVPVLREAGLSEHDLSASGPLNHRISAVGQSRLLDCAAEAIDDTAFGLHLAEQTDPRNAGIIFYTMSAAENLGEALALFDRYSRIVNEAGRLKLTASPHGLIVEVGFIGLPRPLGRQGAEFLMAVIVRALRELAGRNIRPIRVAFAHARNADIPEFARFFGCAVEFGRTADEGVAFDLLELSSAAVAAPLLTSDPKLLKALEPFCDLAAKERRTASDTLRAVVEKEVEKLLPHGKAQKQTVARALGMSARTFARRLAVEETTYEEVVDQLRRSLALQYLKEPGMSLSQIAWLLGYEGSSSFSHAFRRWTGHSPSVVRKGKPLSAPA